MKIEKFEDLEMWKLALRITKKIYDLTYQQKFSKDYELKGQITRAVISISSCIVEGFEKNNNNEFKRFLSIAKGSCGEVRNDFYIALSIGYVTQDQFEQINQDLINESNQIGAFMRYLEKQKKAGQFLRK